MLNPLDVEQQYQNLLLSLSLPATSFQRLRAIEAFLMGLAGEEPAFESYLLDCLDHVPALVKELSRSGHDPDEVRRVYDRLRLAVESVQHGGGGAEVQEALGEIRLVVCGLCAYGAAWGRVSDMLGTPLLTQDNPDPTEAEGSRRVTLRHMAEQNRENDVRDSLERLSHEWEMSMKPQSGMAYVPVVERALGEEGNGAGSLRRLTVKIFGESADGRDAIHGDLAVFGVDREETGLTHIPLKGARSVLRKIDPPLAEKHFDGLITFGNNHELHEGDSAGLAATTLLVCEIIRYANRRIQYQLRPDVALTGSMDGEGNVLAVDEESLGAKVAAAFFSHVETLVVPKGQIPDAEEGLKELLVRYPGRHLDIVGVGHAREVFYDRRVVKEARLPVVAHALRHVWRRKSRTVAITASSCLGLIALWFALGSIDRHPVSVEYKGESMYVRNRFGNTVAEIPVGKMIVESWHDLVRADNTNRAFGFGNSDGDGHDEVFYLWADPENGRDGYEIRAWSILEDRLIWRSEIIPAMEFPGKPDAMGGAYMYTDLVVGDVDDDGIADIFVSAHHGPSFPGFIARISARNGSVLQIYINVGHVADIALVDINKDGKQELLACGTNNAYRRAFVAVLDPTHISGSSPTQGDYTCLFPSRAREICYILMPRSVVGEAFSGTSKGNGALFMRIDEKRGEVSVCVNDGMGPAVPKGWPPRATLNFIFDNNMRPLRIATGDDYDLVTDSLRSRGTLKREPNAAYFERLMKETRVWRDGDSSVVEPT